MNAYFDICELSNASVSKFVLILYVCSFVYYVPDLCDDVTKLSCQTGQYLGFFLQIFRKLAWFCPTITNVESRIISEQNCLINNDLWSHFFRHKSYIWRFQLVHIYFFSRIYAKQKWRNFRSKIALSLLWIDINSVCKFLKNHYGNSKYYWMLTVGP